MIRRHAFAGEGLELRRDRDRRSGWVLLAMTVATLAGVFLALYAFYAPSIGFDVSLVVAAARSGMAGGTLYSDPTGALFGAESPHFYGPPALALAYVPLSLLSDGAVVRVALILGYAIAFASLALLVVPVRRAVGRSGGASLLVGVLLGYAFLGAASLGNPSILVLLGIAIAFVGIDRDEPWLVGLGLGTAAAFRLYPLLLLVPLAVSGRWRAIVASLAVAAAWTAAGMAVFGLDDSARYVGIAATIAAPRGAEDITINAALPAIAARAGASELAQTALRVASVALGAAALLAGGSLLRGAAAERRLLGLGIAVAGMLLIPAAIWDQYLTAVLVLVVGIVAATRRARWGLLSAGLLPASIGGGLALVWLPVLAVAAGRVGRDRRQF